jgi:hypothetical protein
MLIELSRRRGVAAQSSGQAWPIGWSEPARMFAAAQRLIVLIEGIPMSCRDTTLHAPSAWPHVAHLRLPSTSAGTDGAVPLPLTSNASHTQVITISSAELLM